MAKEVIDYDDLLSDSDDIDLGLDDLDFGDDNETDPPKGNAFTEFGKGLSNTLLNLDTGKDVGTSLLRSALPRGYVEGYDFLDKLLNEASSTKDKIINDNADELAEIADNLAHHLEGKSLPEGIKGRFKDAQEELRRIADAKNRQSDSVLPSSDDSAEELKAFLEESKVDQEVRAVNEERLAVKQEAASRADRLIADRVSNAKLDRIANGVMATARGMQLSTTFDRRVSRNYYRKSLEVQYRMFQALRDIRQLSNLSYKSTAEAFKKLIYNTSLPDIMRSHTHERKIKQYYGNNAQTIGQFNANYWGTLSKNIRTGVSEKLSEVFQAVAAVTGDDLITKEFFSSPGRAAGSLAGMGGSFFLNDIMAPILGGRIRKHTSKLSDRLGGYDHAVRHHVADVPGALQRFVDKQDGSNVFTSMLRGFLDQYMPSFQNNLALDKTGYHNLDKAAPFTQAVQRSIVDVIPGYLSRIFSELRVWRTGRNDADVYDFTTGKFAKRQLVSSNLRENIVTAMDRENIQGNLDRFYKQFDPKEELSEKAKHTLSMTLLREMQSNHNFEPDRLLDESLYKGTDDGTRNEILSLLKSRYEFDEDGNLAGTTENRARRFTDGRYFRELKDTLPNPTNDIKRLAGTGIYSELQRSGIIYTVNGREQIDNDRLMSWMLERPTTKSRFKDARRFGPFFKKNQIRPIMTPLGFEQKRYLSKTSRKPITELKDITGPVVDVDGKDVLTYRDLRHGIRNAEGKIVFRIGGKLQDRVDELAGRAPAEYADDYDDGSDVPDESPEEDVDNDIDDSTLAGRAKKRIRQAKRRIRVQANSIRSSLSNTDGGTWGGGGQYSPSYVASVVARVRGGNEDDYLSLYLNDPEALAKDAADIPELLKIEQARLPRGVREIVAHTDATIERIKNGESVADIANEYRRTLERHGKRAKDYTEKQGRRVREGYEHLKGLSREEIQQRIREKAEALKSRGMEKGRSVKEQIERSISEASDAIDPNHRVSRAIDQARSRVKQQFTDADYEDFSELIENINNNEKMSEEEKEVARNFVLAVEDANRKARRKKQLDEAKAKGKEGVDWVQRKAKDVVDSVSENEHVKAAKEKAKEIAKSVDDATGLSDKAEAVKERARELDKRYDLTARIESALGDIKDNDYYRKVKSRFERLREAGDMEGLKTLQDTIAGHLDWEKTKSSVREKGGRALDAINTVRQGGWTGAFNLLRNGAKGLSDRFRRQQEEAADEIGRDASEDSLDDVVRDTHERNEQERQGRLDDEERDFQETKYRNDQGMERSPFVPRNAKEARRQLKLGLKRDRKREFFDEDVDLSGDEFSDDMALAKAQDIYTKGEGSPIIKRRELLAGVLFDRESGKPIHCLDDVTGIVVDRYGNVVLDADDIRNGLYTQFGDRLHDTERTLESRFGKNLKDTGLTRKVLDSIRSARNFPHRQLLPGLIHGICDIYVEGESIPRMTAKGIRLRQYTDMRTGKPIDSTKDITGAILEGNEVIINEEEVKHLVDNNGRKVFIQGAFTRVKRKITKGLRDGVTWMGKKYLKFTKWYYTKLFGHTGTLLNKFFKGNYSGRLLAGLADSAYRFTKGMGTFFTEGLAKGGRNLTSLLRGMHNGLSGGRLLAKVGTGIGKAKDTVIEKSKDVLGKAPSIVRDGVERVGNSLKATREALGNNKALRELGTRVTQLTGVVGEKFKSMKDGFMSKIAHPLIDKGKKALAILGIKARNILKKDGRANLSTEQRKDPQLGLLAGINDKLADMLPKKRRHGSASEIEEASENRLKQEAEKRKKGPFSWLSTIFGRKKGKDGDEDGDDDDGNGGSNSRDRGWGETEKQRRNRQAKNEQRRRRDAARDRRDRMQGRSNSSRATRRTGRAGIRGAANLGRMGVNTVTGTVGRWLGAEALTKAVGSDKADSIMDTLSIAETADDLTGGKGKKAIADALKPVAQKGGSLLWRGLTGLGRLMMADKRVAAVVLTVGAAAGTYLYFKNHHSKAEMEFVNYRLAQYGVYGDDSLCDYVIKLEEACEKSRINGAIDYDRVKEIHLGKIFGVENSDQNTMMSVILWFTKRFVPIHQKHITALDSTHKGIALEDVGSKLSPSEMLTYITGTTFPTTGETPFQYNYSLKGKPLKSTIATITEMFEALKARIVKENDSSAEVYAKLDKLNVDGSVGRKGGDDVAANHLTEKDLMANEGVKKSKEQIEAINSKEGIDNSSKTVQGRFSFSLKRQSGSKIVTDYLRPMQQFRYYAYGITSLSKDIVTKLAALEDYLIPFIKYDNKSVSLSLGDGNMSLGDISSIMGIAEPSWSLGSFMDADNTRERTNNMRDWLIFVFIPIFTAWADGVDSLKKNIALATADTTTDYEQQYNICQRILKAMQGTTTWSWFHYVNVGPEGSLSKEDTDLLAAKLQTILDDLKKAMANKPVNMEVAKPSQQTRDPNATKPPVSTIKGPNDGNMKTDSGKVDAPSYQSYLDNPGDSQGMPKTTGGGGGSLNEGFTVRNMAEGSLPGSGVTGMDGRPPMTADPTGGGNVAMGSGSGGVYDAIPLPKKDGDLESAKPTMEAISKITGVDLNTLLAMSGVESGFKSAIQAGTSSATGWFQMINSTWKSMVNSVGKKYGIAPWKGKGKDPRMADPRINGLMGAEYIKMNYNGLKQRIGREPTAGDLYMAHFMGLGGAGKILNAPRNGNAAALFPTEAAANRSLFWKKDGQPRTVQELIELMTGKLYRFANKHLGGIGGQSVGASSLDPGMVNSETMGSTGSSASVQSNISSSGVSDTSGVSDSPKPIEMTATAPSSSGDSGVAAGNGSSAPQAGMVESSSPVVPAPEENTTTTPITSPQQKEDVKRQETSDTVNQYYSDSLKYQKQTAENTSTLVQSTGTLVDLLRASLSDSDPSVVSGDVPKTAKEKARAHATDVGIQQGRVNNTPRSF